MSVSQQPDDGTELQLIYRALRKLKYVRPSEFDGSRPAKVDLDIRALFPRRFLLKLMNDRLVDLDELADEIVSELVKRLTKVEQFNQQPSTPRANISTPTKYEELDEYFHYCLYYLHDFILDLDWYEPDIDTLSRADTSYVKSKLHLLAEFIAFRKSLASSGKRSTKGPADSNTTDHKEMPVQIETTPPKARTLKSSLTNRLDSTKRRRVRFSDSPKDKYNNSSQPNRELIENQSILALNLLIFALNLFVEKLKRQLLEWAAKTTADLTQFLTLIRESRQKLRSNQLTSILKKIKRANRVYLSLLDLLYDLKKLYLNDYLINIVCACDSEHLLNTFKRPLVEMFLQMISNGLERQIILSLVHQCLQIMLNLIVSEINLPPIELDSDTRSRSREQIGKSRENHLQFILGWLNIQNIFDPLTGRNTKDPETTRKATKVSTLDLGTLFKSSSRVLAQMDNLKAFMGDLLDSIASSIQSKQQLDYFLSLMNDGIWQSFKTLSSQLIVQLSKAKDKNPRTDMNLIEKTADIKAINNNIDLMTAKIRCLKLIHIISSIRKLMEELAGKVNVELHDQGVSLDSELSLFAERCSQLTSSIYI